MDDIADVEFPVLDEVDAPDVEPKDCDAEETE